MTRPTAANCRVTATRYENVEGRSAARRARRDRSSLFCTVPPRGPSASLPGLAGLPRRRGRSKAPTVLTRTAARLGSARYAGRLLPLAQLALLRLRACLPAWWPLMAPLDALPGCSIRCRDAGLAREMPHGCAAACLHSFLCCPPLRRYTSHALRSCSPKPHGLPVPSTFAFLPVYFFFHADHAISCRWHSHIRASRPAVVCVEVAAQ
jgi:hypothetical protein